MNKHSWRSIVLVVVVAGVAASGMSVRGEDGAAPVQSTVRTGTPSNDLMFFDGALQTVEVSLTNPYDGHTRTVAGEFNVNRGIYDGLGDVDTILMTNASDMLLFEVEGQQAVRNTEVFLAGDGADIIELSHATIVFSALTIFGGQGDDILWANAGDDFLSASTGADDVSGGPGNDQMYGEDGDDLLAGGAGNDMIDGGNGTDTVSYTGDPAGVTVNLSAGTAVDGHGGTDALSFVENVIGSSHGDLIEGDAADNILTGGAGADQLAGGGGNDSAVFSGGRAGFRIIRLSAASFRVEDIANATNVTHLIDVERAVFDDVVVNLAADPAVITWPAPPAIVYGTPVDGLLNATANIAGSFSYAPAAGTILAAGTHTIIATFTPDTPSQLPTTASVAVTVLRAPLEIRVIDVTRQAGMANPPFSATTLGFVAGENAAVLAGSLTFTTTATAASPAGTYAIEVSGVSSANYAITFTPGSLTVTLPTQPPAARTGTVTTRVGTPVTGILEATSSVGAPITFALVSQGTRGIAEIIDPGTGAFRYTPAPGVSGFDTFTFVATDGNGSSAPARQLVFVVLDAVQWPGQTIRTSVRTGGGQADRDSFETSLSADGRAMVFSSSATTLIAGDTNNDYDVFVHDLTTHGTARVSVGPTGAQGNRESGHPSMSSDGRYVAFDSSASTLVPGDANGTAYDVFVHDRATGDTRLASVASNGTQGDDSSANPSLSGDGQYVTFWSRASNLVAQDTNGWNDVFVHDLTTGETERVSVASDGSEGDGPSYLPSVSADGRYVAFTSYASNLVANDTNGTWDVFVHDRRTGTTERVSVASNGAEADTNAAGSEWPFISADGQKVAFSSAATTLGAGDSNLAADIFVHDRSTHQTTRVSVSSTGGEGDGPSFQPSLSADGRYVAFFSLASTLVPGDTNAFEDVFVRDNETGITQLVSTAQGGAAANADSYYATVSADGGSVAFNSNANNLVPGDTNARSDSFIARANVPALDPVASNGAIGTTEDTAASGILIAESPGGGALAYSLVTTGTLGTAVLTDATSGAFVYTPAANAFGTDTFTFVATNGFATSHVATVTVTITPVNDPPVAAGMSLSANENVPTSGTLVASDVDGPSLAFSIASNGSRGVATITNAATGAFTYTPHPGAFGTDVFVFRASDGSLQSTATVTVSIVPGSVVVTVVAPNGGEKLFANVPTLIRWTAAGATSFDVAVSRNSGATYVAIPACVGLTGSVRTCAWTPPGPATSTVRFRVTARSPVGATVSDSSDANVQIATATPAITVTAPNTALSWSVGSQRAITWSHNLGATSDVRIELSRDAGSSWQTLAASVRNTAAASGTFSWTVTGPASAAALVRVSGVDVPVSDVSNVVFAVVAPALTVTAPNTNVNWIIGTARSISWSHNLGIGGSARVELSRDGGTVWTTLMAAAPITANTSGSVNWTVTGPVTAAARIRVAWNGNPAVEDVSDVSFRIASRITVTAPNTALTWGGGSRRTVAWTHNFGAAQTFDVAFSADAGATWSPLASNAPAATATTGSAVVEIPRTATTQGLILVSPAGVPGDGDVSNAPITVAAPTITVTAPNTNITAAVGSSRAISWSHNLGTAESVGLEISRDGGSTWTLIAQPVANSANTSGSFTWTVTGPASATARVRVRWTSDGSVQDISNVNFRIQ